MLEHAVDFYIKLFGKEENSGVKLGQDFWEVDEKVTALENELLEAPFTKVRRLSLALMLKEPHSLMVSLFFFIKSFGI